MALKTINFQTYSAPTMPGGAEFVQNGWVFNGRLQAPEIGNNAATNCYIKFNSEIGTISVSANSSSEKGYDYLLVHVSRSATPPKRTDSANILNLSGEDARIGTYNITAPGTYYLHFVYAKDGSGYGYQDTGWINYATLPMIEAAVVNTNVNGIWKKSKAISTNVNGVWKQAKAEWVNINGVWKQSK